jgi:hypothetical protein
MYNNQQGIIASRVNLTIVSTEEPENIPAPENPRNVGDLVYRYNKASADVLLQRATSYNAFSVDSDSSSSSSSSSSEENVPNSSSSSSSSSSSEEQARSPRMSQQGKRSSSKSINMNENHNERAASQMSRQNARFRRSAKRQVAMTENQQSLRSVSPESSSKDEFQIRPQNEQAPNIPLPPFLMDLEWSAVNDTSRINPVESVIELAYQISSDMQNASSIPEQNTLAKFIIMTRLVRIMNHTQLNEVTKKLFIPEPLFQNQTSTSVSNGRITW